MASPSHLDFISCYVSGTFVVGVTPYSALCQAEARLTIPVDETSETTLKGQDAPMRRAIGLCVYQIWRPLQVNQMHGGSENLHSEQ